MASFNNLSVRSKVMLMSVGMLAVVVVAFTLFMYITMRQDFYTAQEDQLRDRSALLVSSIASASDRAYSLAQWIANEPEIQKDFAQRDRQALKKSLLPIYEQVKKKININKFQFHLPPATSFLRLHKPDSYGDDLSNVRKTIVQANKNKKPVLGLDRGRFGFGIRGVTPVFQGEEHLGSVEVGIALNDAFLKELQDNFGFSGALVIKDGEKTVIQASTMSGNPIQNLRPELEKTFSTEEASLTLTENKGRDLAYYFSPVRDYAGETAAVLVLPRDITDALQAMNFKLYLLIGIGLLVVIIFPLILFWLLHRSVTRPLARATGFAQDMAGGDLTGSLAQSDSRDEIGSLTRALSGMAENWRTAIMNTNNGVDTLDTFSGEMNKVSHNLSSGADETSEKANTVASAAEEMSTNMTSVASAMEQTSTNVNNLASSAEEMSTTISDISGNADKTREITKEAVEVARQSSENITKLGKAAQEIDKVSESIAAISSQTDLLALNATIEAARAGESGKGFAVVAGEIKELARQSAEATDDIATKVKSIQGATDSAVQDIEKVAATINKVDEYVESIAASVEEQSAATREIADNVSQSSAGVDEVNEHVNQSSSAASQIAEEIASVNSEARDISALSTEIEATSRELGSISARLRGIVSEFSFGEPLFEVGKVKSAHLKWRTRMESLVHGDISLKPEEVASHHECEFGKWYYDDQTQQKLGEIEKFKQLGEVHAELHKIARKIAEEVQNGRMEKARSLLEEMEDIRKRLFDNLDELYQQKF
jgi:methyl-accepting chemotaxis protein